MWRPRYSVQFFTSPIFVTQDYSLLFPPCSRVCVWCFSFALVRCEMWIVSCFAFPWFSAGISLKCACLIFCFTVGCSQLKRLKWYKERVSEIILYIVIITDVSFWQAYFLFHCGEQRAEERNKECFSFAFSELWVCVCVGMMVVVWPHWFHEC